MRLRVTGGVTLGGTVSVPGDKSIAHRWLILASTARGRSRLEGLPRSLDVRSTARCLAAIAPSVRPELETWAGNGAAAAEGHGSTWNDRAGHPAGPVLEVEGHGRSALMEPSTLLDCGNSGTAMRLLAGVLASCPFRSTLIGDDSLSTRPMDRIATPLEAMGARVGTSNGHPPLTIDGAPLRGIRYAVPVPSAQVKSAILLAGLAAHGETAIEEPARTRDHTEIVLSALGAPIRVGDRTVTISAFQHGGLAGRVPGDPSSAAFLVAAAAITRSALTIEGVGLNPTRLGFVEVLRRMGVPIDVAVQRRELGEPVGDLVVTAARDLRSTEVTDEELPLVVDEVPVLAAVAVHARGDTWFGGAGELRVKETDRLHAVVDGLRGLGGNAGVEGDDLVVSGPGLGGGSASAGGDHRMAMALAVAGLGAEGPCEVEGVEHADVSFPGFVSTLASLGATVAVDP